MLSNTDIDLVVSDMKMPNMNGLEFIQKAKEVHPDVKYFLFTGYEVTPEIKDALKKGHIQKYFRKPFNINEFNTEIEKALGQAY
ncbi:MAG: response regulator [Bacteroidales bacterium]|nr:response regulator [Bacteroidales bacterium]